MRFSRLLLVGLLVGLAPALMAPEIDPCPDCALFKPDRQVLKGNWYAFDIQIPGGMRGDVIVRPTQGNPDLYCLNGTGVSPTNYLCGPQLTGLNEEVCTFEPTVATTYYCIVEANGADSTFTLWVTEADASCHAGTLGKDGYCTSTCTCGYQLGGCSTDADCGGGLECIVDVGASYGWDSNIDVCL